MNFPKISVMLMPSCMKKDVPHSDSQIPPPLFITLNNLPNPNGFNRLHCSVSYIMTEV